MTTRSNKKAAHIGSKKRSLGAADEKAAGRSKLVPKRIKATSSTQNKTPITSCIQDELRRYFDMLDGEEPSNIYFMVMRQAEHALIQSVMKECGGNQSKATKWLGISRGNLRKKLADMEYE